MMPPQPWNEDYPKVPHGTLPELLADLRGPIPLGVGVLLSLCAIALTAVLLARRPWGRRRWLHLVPCALIGAVGAALIINGRRFSPSADARPIVCRVGAEIWCNTEHVWSEYNVEDGAAYGMPAVYLPDGNLTVERGTPVFIHLRLDADRLSAAARCTARLDPFGAEGSFDDEGSAFLEFTPKDAGAGEVRTAGVSCPLGARMPVVVMERAAYLEWAARTYAIETSDMNSRARADRGESMYERGCAGCHSLDGSPSTGPSFLGLYGTTIKLTDGTERVVDEDYFTLVLSSRTRPRNAAFDTRCWAAGEAGKLGSPAPLERFFRAQSALAGSAKGVETP